MTVSIPVPIWIVVLVGVLAAWAVLDRLLFPSVRWYLRRRVNRVINELNERLQLRIEPFRLTRRAVLIDRLTYDPEIMKAAEAEADATGKPREALVSEVARYAREIVPSFNAYAYFRVGYWLARQIARSLYRVRLGYADREGLTTVPENASVVFVMNHRSNMDYVLVGYLAAATAALSYAVGEWARIWPLQTLIRTLGAYFIRRKSGNPLYRKVLARYVQMATVGGVVQAVYPEGGLSRDGRLREPRLGLLSYMIAAFDPAGARDLIFIPVGINYDRVLEDRTLLRSLEEGPRPSKTYALGKTAGFVAHQFGLFARRRWHRFGYACVNFGTPISMKDYLADAGINFAIADTPERFAQIEALGRHLMNAVGAVIPVTPVSLVATVLLAAGDRATSDLEIKSEVFVLMKSLESNGAQVYLPRTDRDYAVGVGLRMLTMRHIVFEEGGHYRVNPDDRALLAYYANAVAHLPGIVDATSA
ncbi:MAG: 1-acyl-sn-glycerol-3-phosphate acyltransferase [Alphaproteobacteria bacterium]|nr:1-acyl-sn-glycerol-3-phosphate acyltransferase [Alphaproteobacteria bacterium]